MTQHSYVTMTQHSYAIMTEHSYAIMTKHSYGIMTQHSYVIMTQHSHFMTTLVCHNDTTLVCHNDTTLTCHNDTTLVCHNDTTLACHNDTTLTCHNDTTLVYHNDTTLVCHNDTTLTCHNDTTLVCHNDITLVCHNDTTLICQNDTTLTCHNDTTLILLLHQMYLFCSRRASKLISAQSLSPSVSLWPDMMGDVNNFCVCGKKTILILICVKLSVTFYYYRSYSNKIRHLAKEVQCLRVTTVSCTQTIAGFHVPYLTNMNSPKPVRRTSVTSRRTSLAPSLRFFCTINAVCSLDRKENRG